MIHYVYSILNHINYFNRFWVPYILRHILYIWMTTPPNHSKIHKLVTKFQKFKPMTTTNIFQMWCQNWVPRTYWVICKRKKETVPRTKVWTTMSWWNLATTSLNKYTCSIWQKKNWELKELYHKRIYAVGMVRSSRKDLSEMMKIQLRESRRQKHQFLN